MVRWMKFAGWWLRGSVHEYISEDCSAILRPYSCLLKLTDASPSRKVYKTNESRAGIKYTHRLVSKLCTVR
ncbi:unnamed protein product [Tuber melanosporum]|uniref:(Perigord truffle) hypothetical protein n=1 Tax=Tuber melanosporum (strain Mel28) TaxID=656061 RepID=D5GIB3_TUBMM|nr:uncharacterized protein GSTUM_00008396001 [Tuber melanosporum]CAZ84256.1 unnamed protein product [Tuber melanosporum]